MNTRSALPMVEVLEPRLCLAQLMFGSPQLVDEYDAGSAFARIAELNTDEIPDFLVTSSFAKINEGDGTFGPDIRIATSGRLLHVADIDEDGDSDFLAGRTSLSVNRGDYSWFQNDGTGRFERHNLGSDGFSSANMAATADIDGDGDIDLLSGISARTPHDVQFNLLRWHENLGEQKFHVHEIDDVATDLLRGIAVGDIDSDGDIDFATNIGWYQNVDGAGSFELVEYSIDSRLVLSDKQMLADVDADGDIDLVSGVQRYGEQAYFLAWFENVNGMGEFGRQQTIDGQIEPIDFEIVDFDRDGDLDVIASDVREGKISWYENYSGSGDFGRELTITDGLNRNLFVEVADVDSDGDDDVLTGNQVDGITNVLLIENLGTRAVGDSNADGVFNSSDLVHVFQAAEYEDHLNHNSTFDEGDWNGDGEFDSADFVFAFQFGNYLAEARIGSLIAARLDTSNHIKLSTVDDPWDDQDDWWVGVEKDRQ